MLADYRGFGKTPHSNTGSTRQEPHDTGLRCNVDYLTFTGQADIEELIRAVWSTFGTNFDFEGARPGTRGRYYETILKSAQGIELAYGATNSSERLHYYRLSIPGSPLNHVDSHHINQLCRYMDSIGANPTRFDWRIDDYNRQLSMDDILRSLEAGDYSGANSWSNYRSARGRGKTLGWTVYIGSPMSEKRVRIYDKHIESNGKINSIRFEVQWRGDYAKAAFKAFLRHGMGELRDSQLSGLAIGSIDFVKRDNEVLSRCSGISWWAAFVSRVGLSTKMSVRRLQPLISDKIHWIEYQVAGTLAVIASVKGFDDTINWLERIIRDKLSHMSGGQTSLIQTIRDRLQVELMKFEDAMVISSWERV